MPRMPQPAMETLFVVLLESNGFSESKLSFGSSSSCSRCERRPPNFVNGVR